MVREACGDISVSNLDARLHDRNGSFIVSELGSGHAFGEFVMEFVPRVVRPWANFQVECGPNLISRAYQRHQPDSPWSARPLVADAADLASRDAHATRAASAR